MATDSLELLRSRVAVDLDQLDPALGARLGPFVNMTSNQALVLGAATAPGKQAFVRDVVARAKRECTTDLDGVELALDLMGVLLAKPVLPHVTSYLHLQVSPRHASNVPGTVTHARRLVSLMEQEGIPRSRVCIKIPTTGAGMTAARQLENEGIATLATTLFSVSQAVAAHQAGCHFVAPYFNPLSVHFDGGWVEYANPAVESPMGPVVGQIVATFKHLNSRTRVMPASIVTPEEALSLSTLGIDDLTLSGKVLEGLATRPVVEADLAVNAPTLASEEDYSDLLANEGAPLDVANDADASVRQRLDYAVKFAECEETLLVLIRKVWDEV